MKSVLRNMVEYCGIAEYIPNDIKAFKQINVDEILQLNEYSPNIKEIVKISVKNNVKHSRIVRTSSGTSLEGQELTGWKFVVKGSLDIRIDYSSNTVGDTLYTFSKNIDFSSFVILPNNYSRSIKVIPSIFVEDIYGEVLDPRSLLINITLLLSAELA
ncbi:MAG: SPOCS domain-containing protein [Clostridium sp.]